MYLRFSRRLHLRQSPMKKKKSNPRRPAPPAGACDVKSQIHGHSLFFDKLVDLIPARFYLPPTDEDRPWFQGLSKAARAKAKQETRKNIKKSRRDRLDPDKPSSTLDRLQKSLASDDAAPRSDSQIQREDNRSLTYEELRQKFRRRLEELRGNRPEKGELEARRGSGKRKRAPEPEETVKAKPASAPVSEGLELNESDVAFNQVKIGGEERKKKKQRKLSKLQELERAEKLEEAKKDPEKGEVVRKKHSWQAAVSRAAGVKVHDDAKLLKQSIKKEKKKNMTNSEKWKERVESREKLQAEKQQKRAGNIAERIHQKKMRKIAKREKKLMRPGFEGRKEGFINDS